ncbi:hypothetical protein GURKE_01170 [Brevundimonas phage vB_BpoS-Gurke]|uniref:Uncharacterized protein n=1 Tax=Brevundimonas phage vB_BpoS-Gurke TaxID=2948599 RepID=A0A9E7N1R6_9CAUD|nr:hypothetical protein GURKE_01170 [Brevundimonas phage vB_BpoS-Gurke]
MTHPADKREVPWDAGRDGPRVLELHRRLGEAREPVRDLDRGVKFLVEGLAYRIQDDRFSAAEARRGTAGVVQRLTASIDAVMGLKDRFLDGWVIGFTEYPGANGDPTIFRAWVGGPGYISDDHMDDYCEFTSYTPALALCGAVLNGVYIRYLGGARLADPN